MPPPPCKFGTHCYRRKNRKHMEEFSHDQHEPIKNELKLTEVSSTNLKRTAQSPLDENVEENVKYAKLTLANDEIANDLRGKFLVSFPPEFFRFWNDIQTLIQKTVDNDDPRVALSALKNLRLLGVFRYLHTNPHETSTIDANIYLTMDRYANDLPEMQTIAVYDGGRFAYWRDTPNDERPLLVHVDSKVEHFAKLELIGVADPVYMVAYLKSKAGDTLPKVDNILAKLLHADSALCGGDGKYDVKVFHKKYDALLKELRAKRRKQALGEPFHGLGIVVKVENDIGYRPLSEKPARLKHQLQEIATTSDAEMKRKLMEPIMELVSYVQFANDEMDFGMGLELGHNLFLSNFVDFDKLAVSILSGAYTLLGRDEFSRILKAHAGIRRSFDSKGNDE
uniref:Aprataxin and PNK-like factor PBZ domain-containing protein n=1 Tax=Parascaris univalens TaxID=6257 RepID=A0A915ATU0_PARUN